MPQARGERRARAPRRPDLAAKLEEKFGASPELRWDDADGVEEDEEDFVLPLYEPAGAGALAAERVVIVGAGPAGLSAALYAARAPGSSPWSSRRPRAVSSWARA